MDIYFSPATLGFYTAEIHGDQIPGDAVKITTERHAELLLAQSTGKRIASDEQGYPVALDPPAPSLSDLKARLVAAISAERDRREENGFPYRGKTLDSTQRSVQRITAAALAAQAALAAGQPFSIDWTTADNSTLTIDATGVIGMPVALAQYAAALHAHSRALKAAVEAAVDQDDLDTIDIQAGWLGDVVA